MTEVAYYKPWVVFWVAAVVAHGYMDYSIWRRIKSWNRGLQQQPHGGRTLQTIRIWLMDVLIQRQLLALSFSRWVVHMLIFWGFICLGALSIFLFLLSLAEMSGVDGGLRGYFLHGGGHAWLKVWGDAFGISLLAGLLLAGVRRLVLRPRQLVSDQSDLVLLVYLIWLTVSGFFLEGLRLSQVNPHVDVARYSFAGLFFVLPWTGTISDIRILLTALWSIHAFSALGLLIYLPKSKLLHSIFGPVVIAMNASEEQERKDIYWPTIKGHRPIK
jgi:heterodisulfide reductase subunit E